MKRLTLYILILMLVLFAGCKEEIKHRINFYHYLHVEEYEFECTTCHGEMTDGMFAQADMDICVECHEDEVEADEISPETCGKCHLDKDLEEIEVADYERPTRGVFRHSEALSGSCRKCHIDTVKEGSTKVAYWTRDDVIAIRGRAHSLGLDCQTCHESINRDTPWDNHKTNWTKQHGMFATEEESLSLCIQCHNRENCRECHQQQAPSSHVNLWRWQTHGIEASWNRENCQTCHQDDFCIGCHTSTKPKSHTAVWGSTNNSHCSNCHLSVTECNICHSGSTNEIHNAYAPGPPGGHINSTACLNSLCHVIGGSVLPENRLPKASHDIFDESECLTCHQGF